MLFLGRAFRLGSSAFFVEAGSVPMVYATRSSFDQMVDIAHKLLVTKASPLSHPQSGLFRVIY